MLDLLQHMRQFWFLYICDNFGSQVWFSCIGDNLVSHASATTGVWQRKFTDRPLSLQELSGREAMAINSLN